MCGVLQDQALNAVFQMHSDSQISAKLETVQRQHHDYK